MLNIDELLAYFIENSYSEKKIKDLYMSLSICEMFGLKYYADDLIDVITDDNTYSNEDKQDIVHNRIYDKIKEIIEEHSITLEKYLNPSLEELNEIANFIYIIQNLEDYDNISYRLNSEDEPKNIIIDIIEQYTLVPKYRLLEIIDTISSDIIKALQELIKAKLADDDEPIDAKYNENLSQFFTFINNTECLGYQLFNIGYNNIDFKDLLALVNIDIQDTIDKSLTVNTTQGTLDILSVIMLCRDTYELPLLSYKKNAELLTSKLDKLNTINLMLTNMITDFVMFKEARKQGLTEVSNG
jgi:hypothetical protein